MEKEKEERKEERVVICIQLSSATRKEKVHFIKVQVR